MEQLPAFLFVLASYLLGSIPFGLVFSKGMGVDIRQAGSGNIGATNVSRLLGKKLGFLTLAADMGKAIVPMLAAHWFLRGRPDLELWIVLCGGAAFLGHIFPVYLKFRGGKGVATALGVFIFLQPAAVLISIAVFIAAVYLSGFVSLGSLLASALMPLWLYLLGSPPLHVFLAFFICAFIWLKHHENIGRLFRGQEKTWKKRPEQPE